MVSHLESVDSHTQLSWIKELREWFSGFISEIDDLESIDVCLLLESIKQTTETSGSQELKLEADVSLIHIISDYLSRYSLEPIFVIKHEVVQVLLDLLEINSVCEKAVEELRKVAFNGVSHDNALWHGTLDTLLKKLETANVSMLRKLRFSISKLCGGKIEPPFSKVS
ncbi:uncharacterized protein LOC132036452 [Lycium ferocissimum]|uniref:uncharacterized protein LOC132036452 n=1 Tax=Lycium ferocissimum TaxID=112874 RepID=UPI002814A897|nr:uncharacterized protein LOC132036452 [Lycium ferocissimum]